MRTGRQEWCAHSWRTGQLWAGKGSAGVGCY